MVKVRIFGDDGVSVVDECPGPSWTGECPNARRGLVACAGRKIRVTDAAGTLKLDLMIEPDAVVCPLAGLNIVGRAFRETEEEAQSWLLRPGS